MHRHLGISHEDFDEAAALLAEALEEHGMEQADVTAVISVIETKRKLIVARAAA